MGQRQTKPDPDKTTLGILFPTSGAALLLLLYMSVFGQRMRYHGIRWHSINFSIWSLFQVFVFSDTAIKTPWPSYLNSKPIESNSQKLMIFLLSVYPAGCFFLFIEKIIHLSAPKLRENLHFHLIYWALTIVFINVILILSFFCEWWGVSPSGGSIWWYDPIDMCQIIFTTVIYIFVVIYLFICIGYAIGGVTCFRNSPTRSWSVTADMWLLLPYVLVPSLLVMTHFSFTASTPLRKDQQSAVTRARWPNHHALPTARAHHDAVHRIHGRLHRHAQVHSGDVRDLHHHDAARRLRSHHPVPRVLQGAVRVHAELRTSLRRHQEQDRRREFHGERGKPRQEAAHRTGARRQGRYSMTRGGSLRGVWTKTTTGLGRGTASLTGTSIRGQQ